MFKSWSHLRYDYDADTTTKRLGVNKIVRKFFVVTTASQVVVSFCCIQVVS